MSSMKKKEVSISSKQLKCVESSTALQLLLLRPNSQTGPVNVSVYSKVIAISEIIQIKETQLFLVKLLPALNIICKRKELLHMHGSVSPQKAYIFTSLRHTTLQKGSSYQRPVYTVTRATEIVSEKSAEVIVLSANEWLTEHGIGYTAVELDLVPHEELFPYMGTITKVLDAQIGVYELDTEVRLNIGQVPAVHKYRHFQVGIKLMIHNAHRQMSTQYPKGILYGCMLTSVRVINHPEPRIQSQSIQSPQILKNYLFLYKLSQRKLDHLYHICKTVRGQFHYFGKRICDKLVTLILLTKELSWKQDKDGNYRNHLDEFLHCPHVCSLKEETDESIPSFGTIKSLFQNMDMTVQKDQHFTHNHVASDQILLGELDVCAKTGRSVLRDSTGMTNTVITCYTADGQPCGTVNNWTTTIGHNCDLDCDCCDLEPCQLFKCPYFHTCCIGKIVAVTKYGIISENGLNTPDNRLLVDGGTKDSERYIVFSMRDAIYLGNKKSWTQEKKTEFEKKNTTQAEQISYSQNYCRVTEKQEKPLYQTVLDEKENRDNDNKSHEGDVDPMVHHGHVTSAGQSNDPSGLHRHPRKDGGTYFCRKTGCADGIKCDMNSAEITETDEGSTEKARKHVEGPSSEPCQRFDECKQLKVLSLKGVPASDGVKHTGRSHNDNMFNIPIKRRRKSRQKSTQDPASYVEHIDCDEINIQNVKGSKNMDISEGEMNQEQDINAHRDKSDKSNGRAVDDDNCEFSDASWENTTETAIVIIHRRDALVIEETNGNQSARFCIQCQIIKDGSVTKATLLFKGRASRWYSVLHHGPPSYKFSVSAELSPLFTNNVIGNSKFKQKLKKLNSHAFMVVNEHADIEEIYQQRSVEMNETVTEMSFKETPTSVFSGVFKDIQGIILSRTCIKNDNTNDRQGRTVEKNCTRIKVKTDDDESVQIYLKPENFSSPLGLVPGSVVCFTRLERRISQLGNVYWRFIPLSSVTVMALQHISLSGSELNLPEDGSSSCPTYYLRDVWDEKPRDTSAVFICHCSVQQILKVSLKYVCDHCGSMVKQSRCSNIGCFSTELGRFLGRASILVDDGTSIAMVTLCGEMIQHLLLLTDEQWEALQTKANKHGEIFVQQARPDIKNDIEQYLYLLCDNKLVKCSWTMKLKLKYTSKYTDLDKMNCDEFGQKTFDTGSNKVTTRCLPFLQLECLQLKAPNPYQICLNLMAN